jgi:hypothetical protein
LFPGLTGPNDDAFYKRPKRAYKLQIGQGVFCDENIGQSLQVPPERFHGLRMQFNHISVGFGRGEFGFDLRKLLSGWPKRDAASISVIKPFAIELTIRD